MLVGVEVAGLDGVGAEDVGVLDAGVLVTGAELAELELAGAELAGVELLGTVLPESLVDGVFSLASQAAKASSMTSASSNAMVFFISFFLQIKRCAAEATHPKNATSICYHTKPNAPHQEMEKLKSAFLPIVKCPLPEKRA